jgi:hypothetical protein
LILLSAIVSQAQHTYRIYNTGRVNYNSYQRDWVNEEPIPTQMRLTIHGKLILISDQAKSSYTTINDAQSQVLKDGTMVFIWDALDEKYRDCVVKMMLFPSEGKGLFFVYYYKNSTGFYYAFYTQEND